MDVLARAVLTAAADQLEEAKLAPLRAAFFCLDGWLHDGLISARKLRKRLPSLGCQDVPTDLERLLLEVDCDGVGVLDYTTFLAVCLDPKEVASTTTATQAKAMQATAGTTTAVSTISPQAATTRVAAATTTTTQAAATQVAATQAAAAATTTASEATAATTISPQAAAVTTTTLQTGATQAAASATTTALQPTAAQAVTRPNAIVTQVAEAAQQTSDQGTAMQPPIPHPPATSRPHQNHP